MCSADFSVSSVTEEQPCHAQCACCHWSAVGGLLLAFWIGYIQFGRVCEAKSHIFFIHRENLIEWLIEIVPL